MDPNARKEPGPSSSFDGSKNQQHQRRSRPPSIRGPGATEPIAQIIQQLEQLDFENDEAVAKKNEIFNARRRAEPEHKMIVIKDIDPLYPGKRRAGSVFCEGEFLQNDKVREAMGETVSGGGGVAESHGSHHGLQELCSGLAAPLFPVTWLKHVTTLEKFHSIVNEGAIRGCDRSFILKGTPVTLSVSCWSPHIPRPEVEKFKNKRLEDFMQRCLGRIWERSLRHRKLPPGLLDLREMGANSPALRPDSRYGNLQFPFRLKELLWSYKEQHCGGQEPLLRVLGTEAYKLEVVHWVLIHSPSWGGFEHLPLLDSVWPRLGRGNLMWAPESTTDLFPIFINLATGRQGKRPRKTKPRNKYEPCRWNNVVFAFHLPGGRTLSLGRGPLLDRVEACETARSLSGVSGPVLRHPPEKYVSKEQAESVIREERVKASSAGQ